MSGCRPLTDDEISRMKANCDGAYRLRDQLALIMFDRTAYRVSELLSLVVKDVWTGREIKEYIQVAAANMKKKVGRRAIPLHPEAKRALFTWIIALREKGKLTSDTPLFLSRKSKRRLRPMSREHMWRTITRIADRAQVLGRVGCHSFLKSFSLRAWRQSGQNILAVKEALGHRQVSSTQTYLESALNDGAIDELFLAS